MPQLGRALVVRLCFALLLIAASLFVPRTAFADPVKAEVSVVVENGFARIIFMLAEDVESQVRVANNIIVVSFERPVEVTVDRLNTSAVGYVSAARRDPDGKGIRIALARKVTVKSMAAGERLFVDLLPDTWSGLPPGLPREVIEELAKRARDAEKKSRQQRAMVRQDKLAPIRVKVAQQPTFTRYVFELPEQTGVAADNTKDRLTLTFDALFKFDLADAKATLPTTIESIDTEIEHESVVVRFNFSAQVDVRTFREDNTYLVDVTAAEAKDVRPEGTVRSDELASVSAELAGRTAPLAGLESPKTVPARAAPAITPAPPVPAVGFEPAVPRQSQRVATPAAPATPAMPAPAAVPPPPPSPSIAVEHATPAVPRADVPAPPPATVAEPAGPAIPNSDVPAPPPVSVQPQAAEPAPAAAAAQRRPAAPNDDALPAAERDTVNINLRRQADSLTLLFPFQKPTSAAIFRRADTLWLVFDTNDTIGTAGLDGESSRTIKTASVTRQRNLAVVRVKLERPRLTAVAPEGAGWAVTLGSEIQEAARPLTISRNIVEPSNSNVTIPIDDPRQAHWLDDPEVGDRLLVVTALAPARGFQKTLDFVEFRALASIHGIVVQPIADDLDVELAADNVRITRPAGLTLSPTPGSGGSREASYTPHVLDTQQWGFDLQANFTERKADLTFAAALAQPSKRNMARVDLARFLLARGMSAEAKGVLDVALADNPATSEDPTSLVLRAITNTLLGRPEEGLKDLANPVVGNQHDAPLWRALAYARFGKWSEAHNGFRQVELSLGTLPLELQRILMKESIRASIEVGDLTGAVGDISDMESVGIPHELEPTLSVLNGRVAEGLERMEDALRAYQAAADSWDRPAAAQGRLRHVVLQNALGRIQRIAAIAELETLTAIWRGDETEVEALRLLARLYNEENRYRDAFHVMRIALTAHPNSAMTQRIQDEAATTFDSLFLAGKGDTLPAIDALALFYDFRDLTPIGRRGDEMIRRLADRLVSVDLLFQATELLRHQVDYRLQGAARAQVATRLAIIYLTDRKPDRALSTLRATRATGISNELRQQRLMIEGRALSEVGRYDVALEVIANISGQEAIRLRADVLWAAKRLREAAEQLELLFGERWREFAPLNDAERSDILRAAIGYALAEDEIGIARFRERYAGKMGEGADSRAFDVITAPIGAGGDEFRDIARSIAAVDTLSEFLRDMRTRYTDTGLARPAAPSAQAPKSDPQSTGSTRPPPPRLPAARTAAR